MDYIIKNHKNVYIRLNENGRPVTCTENDKTLFEFSKAKNILNSLPKTLRRLSFKVEAIPDTIIPVSKNIDESKKHVIETDNYVLPQAIAVWIEKFGICDDILKEAEKRKDELNRELSNIDKQFVNLVHEIELEGKVDLYGGWKERNQIKENREKRRYIKDELFVISKVLRMDFTNLDRNSINRMVAGLGSRKFTYRIVEEEEVDAV